MVFSHICLQEKENFDDTCDPLLRDYATKNYKQLQTREVNVPSDLSTLWEDLFSLRHFRLRSGEMQCYLLTQATVFQHPTNVNGILWENLKFEILRLVTYSNYPKRATKSSLMLARDGFVYIGDGSGDKVMCYSCCVSKNNWLTSEDVSEVHRTLSNGCSMVTGIERNNVPMIPGSETFDKLLQNLSFLNKDEGYDSFEIERDVNTSNIESDAAPLTTQEQIHRNYERTSLAANQGRSHKPTTNSMLSVSSSNMTPLRHQSLYVSPGAHFATLDQGSTVISPPAASALKSQQTTTLPHDNPSPQAAKLKNEKANNEKPNLQDNRQAQSSNNRDASTASGNIQRNTTPNNITTNSELSTNQVVANEPKSSEPPKSSAGKSKDGKGPTYAELGIITERPKRTEYAVKLERVKTFSSWPQTHHIKLEDLADAGFYYAGYGDCARCFFCGGGLRNWEDEDDVWVEHARWFPKCAFIRQLMGQNFVDAVQDLNKTKDKITFTMVTDAMGCSASAYLIGSKTNPLLRDPAVKAMIEFGFDEKTVLENANVLKSKDVQLAADLLLTALKEDGKDIEKTRIPQSIKSSTLTTPEEQELMRQIKEKNNMMRQQTMCKICMDKDVEVVFLPCGHLVSCAECAGALNDCPVCRKQVKGTVRAFFS